MVQCQPAFKELMNLLDSLQLHCVGV